MKTYGHQVERVREFLELLEEGDCFTIPGMWTMLCNEQWLSPSTIALEVRIAVADGRVTRVGKVSGKGNTTLYRKL